MKTKKIIATAVLTCLTIGTAIAQSFVFDPPRYTCYKVEKKIAVDGVMEEQEWKNAPWSDAFVDIQGVESGKTPTYKTRVKMLWDKQNLYLAAELIEPHLWATLTERDAHLYMDNDFEFFIDPDGDTHSYFEFEINALGTEWDLFLTKPYRYRGTSLDGFNIKGLETAIQLYGTCNDPSDIDQKWTLEIKIPFSALNVGVKDDTQWRMNFSRVEWPKYEIIANSYQKKAGESGVGNEENWVWAPTGIIDIHLPEHWGFVQFTDKTTGNPTTDFQWNNDEETKFALRQLLYLEQAYFKKNGFFTKDLKEVGWETLKKEMPKKNVSDLSIQPIIYPAASVVKISAQAKSGKWWSILNDSRVFEGK
ncbi:MAG: carbohydrate-binding family 9-like protein [Bacteroidaceae bacterium]